MLRGITAATGASLILCASAVNTAAGAPERALLGVRIWDSTWKNVLAKHGQPTRIVVGTPSGAYAPAGGGAMMGMMGGSGGPGMMGRRMMGGGPPGMSMPGGFGGQGALPGLPGMGPGGGGGMSPYAQMMMQRGGGGGAAASEGEGPAGFGMGTPGGAGPGMGGQGSAAAEAEEEVTWIYEHGLNTTNYLFNRDGRLIQIQSFGYENGGVTSRGVRLGDTTAKIYHDYGWPESLVKDDARGAMELNYAKKANATFQLVDRHDGKGYRVVGITIGITHRADIPGNRTQGTFEDQAGG
jgi:hypothetical protein